MNSGNVSIKQLATLDNSELLTVLQSKASEGLTAVEVDERQKQYGPNDIIQQQRTSLLQIILNQFTNPIAWLLLIAVFISLVFQDYLEMYAIIAVLFINASIGAITEFKALDSMEALRKMSEAHAVVLRNGNKVTINASELVPGDIVLLNAGDLITADMCLLDSNKLQADESPLTGESLPIAKSHSPTLLSDDIQNSRILYKGTAVLRGTATAVVVNTGTHTELGKISTLISEAAPERSPLEERIQQLSGQLIKLTLGLIVVITILGLIKAESYLELVKTSIALAVAAIPEGMLIVTTLVLARSMLKLAQKNVLIERLSAVETLGSTTLIMTDKTGTLTENKMLVTEVLIEVSEFVVLDKTAPITSHSTLEKLMEIAVLCNNADRDQDSGDPIELALLKMASGSIPDRIKNIEQFKKVAELPFDPDIRLMIVSHELPKNDHCQASIKGAPESILEHCSHYLKGNEQIALTESLKTQWLANVNQMAESGLRVLALGYRLDTKATADITNNFCLVGVVGMEDPLRETVPEAIEQCHNAGIRIIMVTGDNGLTANKIAQKAQLVKSGKDCHTMTGIELKALTDVGNTEKNDELYDVDVFSRVSPRQKYDLAEFYQSRDHVVAMTGDGVNDGPALKNADIGIAMGIRGTEVAKQAADMVLLDDSFPAIAEAIAQGRSVFNNIRKFVLYLLSCNLSEILVVSVAVLSGFPIPLLPLQILFLNLVTDVFPALALGACKGETEEMEKPPREQSERIIESKHWQKIVTHALMLTTLVFSAFLIDLYYFESSSDHAVTVAFLTLAISQLLHVFNMREDNKTFWNNEVIRNGYVWIALGICAVLILVAVYVPLLSRVLNIVDIDGAAWLLVLAFSSVTVLVYTFTNMLQRFIQPH
ncbi:cation-translocating P-type ATPase [Kangiella sediminilitoris]|uniref:ATPase, P-type (Transporting), HAD superfamily, subfamily IC n=1 Tax=Kangiella sediminilitoris TaxID=1144748 RepID=A0A1B3BAN3_9GAMM|nr:cation-transporting P-type ATPase [Kangiella sediminilitoris]AOE49862.1 ATPase, P-type (Transporting), HAD superfamily, subfamily IC [Kangiella sediminilitoris]